MALFRSLRELFAPLPSVGLDGLGVSASRDNALSCGQWTIHSRKRFAEQIQPKLPSALRTEHLDVSAAVFRSLRELFAPLPQSA